MGTHTYFWQRIPIQSTRTKLLRCRGPGNKNLIRYKQPEPAMSKSAKQLHPRFGDYELRIYWVRSDQPQCPEPSLPLPERRALPISYPDYCTAYSSKLSGSCCCGCNLFGKCWGPHLRNQLWLLRVQATENLRPRFQSSKGTALSPNQYDLAPEPYVHARR